MPPAILIPYNFELADVPDKPYMKFRFTIFAYLPVNCMPVTTVAAVACVFLKL